jgi:prolyl oligopeptidase
VMDVKTRAELIPPIDRTDLDAGESGDTGIGWLPDESGFFFNRLAPGAESRSASEKYKWSQAYLRRFGRPDDEARRPVFGSESGSGIAMDASDVPFVFVPPDERMALALVIHGTQREFTIYSARLADVLADRAKWKRMFGPEAKINGMSMRNHTLYLLSHDNAPRFKVLKTRLDKPDVARATKLYEPDRGILVSIASAWDALYLKVREGTKSRLLRIPHGRAVAEEVVLPAPGTFEMINPDGRIAGVLIRLEGWNRAYQYYRYVPRRGQWINDGLQPRGVNDVPGNLEVVETEVRSHDGVMVPLSIVHRKALARDGRNPTLLLGYAAYGSTDEPAFDPTQLAWLEKGGVNATCHARGGGIHGRTWYEAGKGPTKPNTWKDAIACAEWLIANGYASPSTLAIFGGSAGGIFAGRAITERPELFAAAVLQVGAVDMVRSETTATGSQNIPEFGSVSTAEGFRALHEMSAYRNVKDGVRYPAVLFIHGVNDARVDVWHSLKMHARLREATASVKDANPLLLRLDFDAGHGAGSSREQHWQELADMWAFVLSRTTADPAFRLPN